MTSPHIKLGGDGPLLHFSHANGYPPMAYRTLLEAFTNSHQVIASLHRPLWREDLQPESLHSWELLGDDLLKLIESQPEPVVSIGHSMGSAAIVMAAAKRPELFRQIVLIEPVLMPRRYFLMLKLFRRFAGDRIPLVRKTLDRVDVFSSREAAFEHYRPKFVFKNISDEVLLDYIEHGFEETGSGEIRLSYSKEWEAHCYTRAHSIWHLLPKISVPVLAIRGAASNTLSQSSWKEWQAMSPQHEYLEFEEAGHLVPFEQPSLLAEEIQNWLANGASSAS